MERPDELAATPANNPLEQAPGEPLLAGSEPLPLPPPRPKFCNACGAALDPAVEGCPRCGGRQRGVLASETTSPAAAIRSALVLYFVLLAGSIVAIVAIAAKLPETPVLMALLLADAGVIGAWTVGSWKQLLPALTRRVHALWYGAAVGGAVVTFLAASAMLRLLHHLVGMPEIRITDDFLREGYGWGTIILCNCVQPAIFEELAFRGVIQGSLQPSLAPGEAIAVSALMFMTLHLTIGSFPHLLLIGLVLGYLRHRTGSLLPGMLLHFTHNLLSVVAEQSSWG